MANRNLTNEANLASLIASSYATTSKAWASALDMEA